MVSDLASWTLKISQQQEENDKLQREENDRLEQVNPRILDRSES